MAVVILFWDKLWPFTVTSNKKVAVQKDKIILWVKIVFACIPAAIVGALLLGVSRSVASEFTFCLAVPVMFGASFLKVIKHGFHFTGMEVMIYLQV
ncbi:MAG: undecaprenyl-diphosphate phosphatase [Anaerostipes sp.]